MTQTRNPPISRMLLVANYHPDNQRSMQRFAELLQRSLQCAGVAAQIWYPPVVFGLLLPYTHPLFKWLAYVDKLLLAPLALLLAQIGHDRVHICDHSNSYYGFSIWGRRWTASCHDVMAIEAARGLIPGWHVGRFGPLLQRLISAGLGAADHIYCVSNHTREHLLKLQLAPAAKVSVALNPIEPVFAPIPTISHPTLANRSAITKGRYFIHVGSDHWRKNRKALLQIFSALVSNPRYFDCDLLLVGPELDRELSALSDCLGIADRIHVLNGLSDESLATAYRGAVALIYPSWQEGFGWPVAEAQACGCPVFAHEGAPLPEVGGIAAKYFNANYPADAASLIANSDLGAMRAAGLLNAQRFRLEELAHAVLA
jgi:glycosyltransferase involved in cell wall biosynthesis